MKYRIGQKVVYIGADLQNHPIAIAARVTCPMPNKVYTIRGRRHMPEWGGENGYVFEEIINPVAVCVMTGHVGEMHVNEKYLRPLTDISQFHEIRKAVERGVWLSFRESADL